MKRDNETETFFRNELSFGECDLKKDSYSSKWIIAAVQLIIMLITIGGNSLVIISVLLVKALKKAQNYLILSIAIADLLVGVFVMPCSMMLQFNCDTWPAGTLLCDVWISVDVLTCSASIFNLAAIAFDRYVAIVSPIFYKVHATMHKTLLGILWVWLSAAVLAFPTIFYFGNEHYDYEDPQKYICSTSFNAWCSIFIIGVCYLLPSCIMMYFYGKIFIILGQVKSKKANWKAEQEHAKELVELSADPATAALEKIPDKNFMERIGEKFKEHKGSAILGIIIIAFLICWMPFFVLGIGASIFHLLEMDLDLPPWVFERFVWLGYMNSCLNPFIYAMFNQEFRTPFREIVCFRCTNLNLMIRQDNYSQQVQGSSRSGQGTSGSGGTAIPIGSSIEN